MPNNLTDTARKAYMRRRVYIPEWMQLAQWVAVTIIPLVIVISFVLDKDKPLVAQPPVTVAETVDDASGTLPSTSDSGRMITLRKSSGSAVKVPTNALEAAVLAGTAMWTGDWSGVPVTGTAPVTGEIFPDLSLGTPEVYSSNESAIVFVFPLDSESDGSVDQTFQVSVINEGGRWLFPSVAG